jgi:hypothetical protein
MKRMEEHEVLHLGLPISSWRHVVGCIRNSAKLQQTKGERDELSLIASSLEAHLPSGDKGE